MARVTNNNKGRTYLSLVSRNHNTWTNTTTVGSSVPQQTQQAQQTSVWATGGDDSGTFMRERDVIFTADGLKPNTVYYPFFNKVDVSAYCSTVNGQLSSEIKTNALGYVTGTFHLPKNAFTVGTKVFELVDHRLAVGATYAPDPMFGGASAMYQSNGMLKTQQTQVTTTPTTNSGGTPVPAPVTPQPPTVIPPPTTTNQVTNLVTTPVKLCNVWKRTEKIEEYKEFTATAKTPKSNSSHPAQPTELPTISAGTFTGDPYAGWTWKASVLDSQGFNWVHTYIKIYTNITKVNVIEVKHDSDTIPPPTPSRPAGIGANSLWFSGPWTYKGQFPCTDYKTVRGKDPLAQSFFIDAETFPSGLFVEGIELYFKSTGTANVTVEIRMMEDGYPSPIVLPNATALVNGGSIALSNDGSSATQFKFQNLVYLQPNTEYCFVAKAPTTDFNVFTSRVGEKDLLSSTIVDTNPFIGTLFKSENDSTWIASSYEDVKFTLYAAQFNIDNAAMPIFKPKYNSTSNTYNDTGVFVSFANVETTNGTKTLSIKFPAHSLITSDKIFIDSVDTGTYNNLSSVDIAGEHVVTVVDEDNFTITIGGTNNASVTGAVASNNKMRIFTNIAVNEVLVDYLGTEFDNTSIREYLSICTGVSYDGAETPYVHVAYQELPIDGTFYEFPEPRMISSPRNETLHTSTLLGNKSITFKPEFGSTDPWVSPVIDTTAMSIVGRTFVIDNQADEFASFAVEADYNDPTKNSEIIPSSGNAAAKYKSKINLLDDYTNKIQIFVSANCPSPAVFDVYLRVSNDVETHIDGNWIWLPINGVFGTPFTNSTNSSIVSEWFYQYTSSDFFNVFDVKIVMRSTNNSIVPKLFGVRTVTDIII